MGMLLPALAADSQADRKAALRLLRKRLTAVLSA
jgi:hypothetical protein